MMGYYAAAALRETEIPCAYKSPENTKIVTQKSFQFKWIRFIETPIT